MIFNINSTRGHTGSLLVCIITDNMDSEKNIQLNLQLWNS